MADPGHDDVQALDAAHITFLNLSANTNDPSVDIQESWSSANSSYKGGYNWSNYPTRRWTPTSASFGKTSDAAEQKTIITDAADDRCRQHGRVSRSPRS